MWVFDLESDNFLESATRLHCIVAQHVDTGELRIYHNDNYSRFAGLDRTGTIEQGVSWLADTDLVGHNIQGYDIPLIKKLYKMTVGFNTYDTVILSRLLFPDMYEADVVASRVKGKTGTKWLPQKLMGKHSLEAWGHRLGEPKIDYVSWCQDHDIAEPFAQFRPEMLTYCVQDVATNVKLWKFLCDRMDTWGVPLESFKLELQVHKIIQRQIAYGVAIDIKKVEDLYRELSKKRAQIARELQAHFGAFYVYAGRHTPKKSLHYQDKLRPDLTEGAAYTKVKQVIFEPGSRLHVANRLKSVYGWRPKELTPKGEVKVDEAILRGLTYPPAKQLAEYYMLDKRCGQIADGKNSWLAHMRYEDNNTKAYLHGDVITIGAVTSRMAHTRPNLGQVPRVGSPYGLECRSCFIARPGKVWVGCDAEGIEFRALAHYAIAYGGEKIRNAVVAGEKAKQTDVHSLNMIALGLQEYETGRDTAKSWIYALLYGAGDYKLGMIINDGLPASARKRGRNAIAAMGKASRGKVAKKLPGLIQLVDAVKSAAKRRGWIRGLDGRRIPIRSAHSALNTLFQSFGAIVMKRALVIADQALQESGLTPGEDYEFVLNIHDEWQVETTEMEADRVGKALAQAITAAGEFYNTLCPLAGDYKIGKSWVDTH